MAGACASDWPRLVSAVWLSSRGARLPAGLHSCTVPCSVPGEVDRHQQNTLADLQTLGKRVVVQYDVRVDKAAIGNSVTDITIPVWASELPAGGK